MSLPLVNDPSIAALVNDTGTGQDGSVVNKALFVAIATAIDVDLVIPGELDTPAEIGAEVIAARGTLASLDARISGVIDANGEFVGAVSLNPTVSGVLGESVVAPDLLYMSNGDDGNTSGAWYKADADLSIEPQPLGFATGTILTGETGAIQTEGRVTGLAGLVEGEPYYISATPGQITAIPPPNRWLVGYADSPTSLIIAKAISAVDAAQLNGVNLCKDPTFLIWAAGDALAPTHFTLAGAGATIARCGTGLGDTNRKVGTFSAKVTAAGALATFLQSLMTTASYDDYFDLTPFSFGAWVKCSAATAVRVCINDGVSFSYSRYHSGGGGWEFLTVTKVIAATATKIEHGIQVEIAQTAYVSGPTMIQGFRPPNGSIPAPCAIGALVFKQVGSLSGLGATVQRDTFLPGRPALVKHIQLHAKTAPTGQALKVDVNTWDGAAFTTMCTTKPEIAIAATLGGGAPDGTYARRCLSTVVGATGYPTSAGYLLTWDLDQVGSAVPGSDLTVIVRILQFLSPLEDRLGITEIS